MGSRVRVAAGDGIVRWIGTNPEFATGKWVGVELYVESGLGVLVVHSFTLGLIRFEANGKNDGSVQGKPYFRCKPKFGVFVRPSQVQILDEDGGLGSAVSSRPESRSISRGPTVVSELCGSRGNARCNAKLLSAIASLAQNHLYLKVVLMRQGYQRPSLHHRGGCHKSPRYPIHSPVDPLTKLGTPQRHPTISRIVFQEPAALPVEEHHWQLRHLCATWPPLLRHPITRFLNKVTQKPAQLRLRMALRRRRRETYRKMESSRDPRR